MKRIAFILIITFFSLNCAVSQKIRNASGTAQFRLEEDMSKDELKEKLRHHAIINAIEREYGTYVTQESFVDVDDGNTRFRIFGKTVIRGEWLKTTHEDFKEEVRKNKDGRRNRHELWMSLKIEGKVREISKPEIEFNYFTSDCRKEVCKTGIFENGDPMYLHFTSPVDGYLSVYVAENDEAYRLLPYQSMPKRYKNAIPVVADKDYVFFSPFGDENYFDDFSKHLIDELIMLTDKEEEYVNLYLVFSTEEFTKPSLTLPERGRDEQYERPKSLSPSTLTNWLESNRINNENFYYRQLKLKIIS
ncbi:MAG: hypothetical protein MI975_07615 [Cytophagales bacterium]|nr:hypothetical protein [Cytophagales bacterium]